MSTPSATPVPKASTSTTGRAPERGPRQIAAEIGALLDELRASVQPIEIKGLLLNSIECNALEEILGLGATRDAIALLSAVTRLGSIKIGDIRIPFTPGQLSELQHRAAKRGHSVEQEMRAVVARIEDELFYRGS
jgi:hypothetical protein